MTFEAPGKNTLEIEVTNVSRHGFWLFVDGRELFVSFQDFPWFQQSTIHSIINVILLNPDHLYWPELDIDLSVESIEHPERYPLISK